MKKIIILVAIITTGIITAQTQPKPSVDVWGEGTINVVPDQVTVNVRIENTGTNAKEVKLKNDRIVSDVFQFVKGIGIAEKYIKTEYIRLSKNYEYQTKTYNYQANQSISIKLVDLSEYEPLMNGLL
ncbi:MAG: SIMPL domain-containing protein, partial [Bacteroidetes bacterium]|nr:SIMPL domain-containing protein [Bacteroidota bacterium]